MTTVELSDRALDCLKEAKDEMQKKFSVKMRMPDIMEHLITNPQDVVDRVFQSIQKKRSDK